MVKEKTSKRLEELLSRYAGEFGDNEEMADVLNRLLMELNELRAKDEEHTKMITRTKLYVIAKLEVAGDPDDGMLPVYTGLINGVGKRGIISIDENLVIASKREWN